MAILYASEQVDIIDCAAALALPPLYTLPARDFDVPKPYYSASSRSAPPRKRQKPSRTDHETDERHVSVLAPLVASSLDETRLYWQKRLSNTDPKAPKDEANDNEVAGDTNGEGEVKNGKSESTLLSFPDWLPMAKAAQRFQSDTGTIPTIELDQEKEALELPLLDLFGSLVVNGSDACCRIKIASHDGHYVIPPRSRFFMGDLDDVADLGLALEADKSAFDLIVMDPPWPNKSVHRSAGYETQDIYDLFKIPLASLLEPGGLVAVWVTNKPKFRRFIQDKLFPAWGVACVGEWVWVKVTNDGSPVFPLDSPHRKPYEQLILGRRAGSSNSHGDTVTPPYHHILMSIPSTQHSRKPPLQDILSRYMQKDARCLEMFARCLMPGWTSWGNECIKFQHETFFERVQDK